MFPFFLRLAPDTQRDSYSKLLDMTHTNFLELQCLVTGRLYNNTIGSMICVNIHIQICLLGLSFIILMQCCA